MAGIVKYEIAADEATGVDTTINGEDKILPVEATIDSDVPYDFINGENGLEIASDFLTGSAEALDAIIDQSLKDFPDEAKRASKFLVKIPFTIAQGALNFVSEIQLEYDSSGNLGRAIYVATGETIVELSVSSVDLFGSLLDWSADKFGDFSRFGIGTAGKLSFIELYREYSEENVRDFFGNGYDSLERFAIDSYDAFIEAGAELISPAPSLNLGADVTVINDPEYDSFKYIKNPVGDNEIELIAPYNILEAAEDDGDDLVIRSGELPIETDASSIIDGGVGQDTISYAEADLPNGVEINLDLGVSSSLDRNTGLGNGFPIDVLDNFENVVGSQNSDYIVGNNLANTLEGLSGDDTLDGGEGEDTVVFSDDFANYDYEIAEDGTITLTHARGTQTDGTDTLTNVEFAQFKDQTVSLPLEETEYESDDGSVTFKFETTLDSELSTVKILDTDVLGTNPNISLSYTFNSDAENKSPFPSLGLYELNSAQLSINDKTAILNILEPDDGNISVITEYTPNQKAYKVDFSYTNDVNPPSLFGQDISVVQITLIDDDFNLFDNTSLPTDPSFVENIDQQNILITFKNNAVLVLQENTSIFEIEKTPFTLTSEGSNSVESAKPIVEDKPSEIPQEEAPEDNNNIISDTETTNSQLNGTDNDDLLEGTSSNDDIFSGSGDDTIIGGLGSDYISLEGGSDLLIYNSSAESSVMENGNGADLISGFAPEEDKIDLSALGFNSATDLIATQYTDDEGNTISEVYSRNEDGFSISFEGAYEFQTSDFIFDMAADGSSQLDTLTGSENNDSPFYGSFGSDYIEALAGSDDIFAGSGDDTVVSGAGDDYLELGAGNDVILVSSLDDSSNESGVDYVGDFVNGEDKIDVSALGFSDVDNFSVYQENGYTEIYNGDFALGFDGDYNFNNADFIFG